MKITRAEVEATIKCGDGIAVTYLDGGFVAKLLRWAEGGQASHFIECFGGLDTFEETIGGGMHTNLDTYLRGNCILTIRRAPRDLTPEEQARVRSYWMSLVGKGYGWDSIKRSAVTVPIRRFIRPHCPKLARALIALARWALPGKMPDCSAAWVDGIRLTQPVLRGYDASEVDPENLRVDPTLTPVAVWKAYVLEDA